MLRMLSICSCLMNRTQDKITVLRYVINPLKVWQILNIWEQTLQINIAFVNKLRTDWTQGECLLPFGPESFVFWFIVKKYEVENIQNYSCGCCFVLVRETWFLSLRAGQRLGLFESTVQRKLFVPNRDKVAGAGGDIMRSFMILLLTKYNLGD